MQSISVAQPLTSHAIERLSGTAHVPGDKSISHRSLLLASQCVGKTQIDGLLEGEDVLATAAALRHLGIKIDREGDSWLAHGNGIGGLHEPSAVLDMGNSGTGVRLMMGLVAPYEFTTFFTGDESLCKRPMARVMRPLEAMGVRFHGRSEGRLPLAVIGTTAAMPIEYELPVASAQVKSAILLAGLNTAGKTTVIEPHPSRDHTELMLRGMGCEVEVEKLENGGRRITLTGQPQQQLQDNHWNVPADPSSAAFVVVAALLASEGDVLVPNVCVNPLRTGLFDVLREMGGDISFENAREANGEPVADIRVRASQLHGVDVPESKVPSMVDEYPILAVAAACAKGETVMRGLAELRVKESDRLLAILEGLKACGVQCEAESDTLIVTADGTPPIGGGTVTTHYDHRIAMAFCVLGMVTKKPVTVDDARAINTSFPNFVELMHALGADIRSGDATGLGVRTLIKPMVIAIDGPAASGKGTLARRLAEYFDFGYLDTGSLYRAVGLRLVYNEKDPNDVEAAIEAAREISEQDFSNPRLRQERIGQAASVVSAMPEVRDILLDYQRKFAERPEGAVLDGRDIGTIVCPSADLKLFLTASVEARADRRHRQLQGQGIEVVYDSVRDDLVERDERDQRRQAAPLKAAEDAITLDTSEMSANEVFEFVLEKVLQLQTQKVA